MKNLPLPTCDNRALWDVHVAVFQFPTLAAADELGVFALLERAPRTAAEVAEELRLEARGMGVLLGLLAAMRLLVHHGGRFHLTEVARNYLVPHSPYYYGAWLRAAREVKPSWTTIVEALRAGGPVPLTEHVDARDESISNMWESGAPDPAFLRFFAPVLHALSLPVAVGLAARGGLPGAHRVLDVAGGAGTFSIALALCTPELHCTVLDFPIVCEIASETAAQYGLSDRIHVYAADMFRDEWPAGHDTIFFSEVFHDWDAPRCQELARRSFAALPSGGRIHVHEMLLSDTKDGPPSTAAYSVGIMLATRGKQYSFGELAAFLEEAGFGDVTAQTSYGYYSIVSATKP